MRKSIHPQLLELRTVFNGTLRTFDLLNGGNGVFLDEWRPAKARIKNSGVYQDSPLVDGRAYVHGVYSNTEETFSLKYRSSEQDEAGWQDAEMDRFLMLARSWRADTDSNPVYLVFHPRGATNPQYAMVVNGETKDLEAPFGQTFFDEQGNSVWDQVELSLERGHWLENVPGEGTAVPVGTKYTFNSLDVGNVDSSGDINPTTTLHEAYMGNADYGCNITHVFAYEDSVFSSNLQSGPFPVTAFNSAVSAVRYLYFIVDQSVDSARVFSSLVVNVVRPSGDGSITFTGAWEYWNGTAWNSGLGSEVDNTNLINDEGVNTVHWNNTDWTTTTVNSVTGYVIRLKLDAVANLDSYPVQLGQAAYTIASSYTELQSSVVKGSLPALAQWQITVVSRNAGIFTFGRVIAGLRSVDRGSSFSAHLNVSDRQPANVSIYIAPTSFADDVRAPTGRSGTTPLGTSYGRVAGFLLSPPLSQEYTGRFHAYLRISHESGSATEESTFYFTAETGYHPIQTNDPVVMPAGDIDDVFLDLGSVHIPNLNFVNLILSVYGKTVTSRTVRSYTLILIPTDEWSADVHHELGESAWALETDYLDIDAVGTPNGSLECNIKRHSDAATVDLWKAVANGPAILQVQRQQRLWIAMARADAADTWWTSDFETCVTVQAWKTQRYLGLRGNE